MKAALGALRAWIGTRPPDTQPHPGRGCWQDVRITQRAVITPLTPLGTMPVRLAGPILAVALALVLAFYAIAADNGMEVRGHAMMISR